MAQRMPPPGTDGKGLAIIIGVPHGSSSGRMPPPGQDQPQQGGKASREDAGFVGAEQHCIDCDMYTPETGDCSAVEGVMDPQDGCHKYFEPVGDDESNEAPDADDSTPQQGPEDSQQ